MYTFSYIDVLDYTADGGPKMYRLQDTDTGKYYYVDFSLVGSSAEALAFIKNYGIVRWALVTGATKTKVTYNEHGLVTGGADATTADIADSTNKRYVTDAHLTALGSLSSTYVPTSRTVNGHALSSNVTLAASDVGAAASGLNGDITGLSTALSALKAENTAFKLQDNTTKFLQIRVNESMSGNYTLELKPNSANRVIDLSGNLTVTGATTISGTHSGTNTGDTWKLVKKAVDEPRNTTTTEAADTNLVVTLAASTSYMLKIRVYFNTGASEDFKYSLNAPGSPTVYRAYVRQASAGSSASPGTDNEVTFFNSSGVTGQDVRGSGTEGGYVFADLMLTTDGSGGDFTFDWAQDSSGPTNTVVLAGSYIEYIAL